MRYNKIITSLLLIGSLFIFPIQVGASNTTDNGSYALDPYSKIPYVDGETSAGVQVVSTQANLAFEVPLYVTMAVTDTKEEVVVPDNYGITNLSTGNDGSGIDIAVIAINVTPMATRNYWEFVTTEPTKVNEILLTIGGIPLILEGSTTSNLDIRDSVFYDDGKYIPIGYGESNKRLVPIVGRVQAAARSNKPAVAQFSISYTISQLDDNGNPVATFYEGAYPEGYLE